MRQERWRGAVAMIQRAHTARGRAQVGFYTIEGIRHHERALRAQMALQLIVASQRFWEATEPRQQKLKMLLNEVGCPIHIVPNRVMMTLTNGRDLGGIVSAIPLPPPTSWHQLLATAHLLLLVAVDVVDPGNMGALVRTAHAAGATAVFTTHRSDPFHPRAVRTSMGSLFKMPTRHYNDIDDLLTDCHNHHITTVGTAVTTSTLLPQATFGERRTAVFLGNEYNGLPIALSQRLDQQVTIPMATGVDSYSVNAAAAIILYEMQRHHYAHH